MLKLPLGLATFEGTTLTVRSSARRAAALSARAVAGQGDSALMTEVRRAEWIGLWIIMALAAWRSRLRLRSSRS